MLMHPLSPVPENAILVLDDEKPLRHIVKATLASRGIPVVGCSHSSSLIQLLQKHPGKVRAILLDQFVKGDAAITNISEWVAAAAPGVPVFISTSSPFPPGVIHDGLAPKPFAFIQFLEHLQALEAKAKAK